MINGSLICLQVIAELCRKFRGGVCIHLDPSNVRFGNDCYTSILVARAALPGKKLVIIREDLLLCNSTCNQVSVVMTMSGPMSHKRFHIHSDSRLALTLWKLIIIAHSFLLSNVGLVALFVAVGDDVCCGGPTVSGSKSEAIETCDGCDGVM